MLFDTDVLIWLFRGDARAARVVQAAAERELSVVTYMELLQGARNLQEARLLKSFLADFAFRLLPLSENIGHRAAIYMEEYALRSGLCPADALIAATAVENQLPLQTGDRRHFRAIRELELRVFQR